MASYPQCITDISIHALLAESDGMSFSDMYPYDNFYPRSPCGERLVVNKQRPRSYIFLSTLSLRRATFGKNKNAAESQKFLSTLSLRRATRQPAPCTAHGGISIHALLAESDEERLKRSARNTKYFYPRSPCGERRACAIPDPLFCSISIHALLAESDYGFFNTNRGRTQFLSTLSLRRATSRLFRQALCPLFLSTLSLRRATQLNLSCSYAPFISIHALLAESDGRYALQTAPYRNFYPRSPCGERPMRDWTKIRPIRFLSTLSLRRATAKVHKTVGHFCAYETNFMGIASSC